MLELEEGKLRVAVAGLVLRLQQAMGDGTVTPEGTTVVS